MSQSITVHFDGVEGESSVEAVGGASEAQSYDIAVSMAVAPPSGSDGLAGGTAQPGDLLISKEIDKATIPVMLACANGSKIKEVIIQTWVQPGEGEFFAIYECVLSECMVRNVTISGDKDMVTSRPNEEICIAYEKAQWIYRQIEGAEVDRNYNYRAKKSE